MIRAHQVATILGEKLIIDPIQRNTNVTAAVHVSEMLPLEVDQHRFHPVALASQRKLLAFAVSELAHPSNEFLSRAFIPLC